MSVFAAKFVYRFGGGVADGDASLKEALGGKGANLAEMSSIGLPVPPGFTIGTAVCQVYYDNGQAFPDDLKAEVAGALNHIASHAGMRFGDPANPLLVSVRSGARVSMPGMMDTVLNLGLNDATVEGLAAASGDARFAWDSYRRFIQMYADVVLGVDHYLFEDALEIAKEDRGVTLDTELSADDLQRLVARYKALVLTSWGDDFPQDVNDQLWGAIGAVFGSWRSERARVYRRLNDIPESWGTAVTVQAMVFGNMGETSATGVAFTRDPSTGEHAHYGEFLINAQGEDVVAGIRTPQYLTLAARERAGASKASMEEAMPEVFGELAHVFGLLERHYRDMQDIEFTVQQGKLWMLQTRSGKRTAKAALKIAVDMADEGLITSEEAVLRVDPAALDQLLHPTLDPKAPRDVLTKGLPASPGAASGAAIFDSDTAEMRAAAGESVILVRTETSPEDIHGMHAAKGILTARGGMTSHAAVVARGMGRPCVSGAGTLSIDLKARTLRVGGRTINEGDMADHRRVDRRSHGGPRRDRRARDGGRLRSADGVGRRPPPHAGPRQCRDAARLPHRARLRGGGHRAVPHRAHVLRRRPYHCRAPDDPGRGRRRARRGTRRTAPRAARRLRADLRDHGRATGDDPPARPAAARVPAEP